MNFFNPDRILKISVFPGIVYWIKEFSLLWLEFKPIITTPVNFWRQPAEIKKMFCFRVPLVFVSGWIFRMAGNCEGLFWSFWVPLVPVVQAFIPRWQPEHWDREMINMQDDQITVARPYSFAQFYVTEPNMHPGGIREDPSLKKNLCSDLVGFCPPPSP